jgi:hypothetical protein
MPAWLVEAVESAAIAVNIGKRRAVDAEKPKAGKPGIGRSLKDWLSLPDT